MIVPRLEKVFETSHKSQTHYEKRELNLRIRTI